VIEIVVFILDCEAFFLLKVLLITQFI